MLLFINVSQEGLPLVIEGVNQLRTLMVFYDQHVGQSNQQNDPTHKHEYTQLVPGGQSINDDKCKFLVTL